MSVLLVAPLLIVVTTASFPALAANVAGPPCAFKAAAISAAVMLS
jgi:hypothetical protein